jgi:hypothetical protein
VHHAHPARAGFESFIAARFGRAYGADVTHFMPHLLGVRDGLAHWQAAAGYAAAGVQPFFLEQYLDQPIERLARSFIRVHPRVLGLLADNGPERLFARLNQILPGLVDFSLRRQLPVIRRHARESDSQITSQGAHP